MVFIARLGTEALAAASLSTSLFGQMVWTLFEASLARSRR